MTTQSKPNFAFVMVLGGVMVVGNSIWTVVHRPYDPVDSGWHDFFFLAISWAIAAIFAIIGGRRLREMKKAHPGESWLKFLRDDLIMTVVMIAATAAVAAMPEAWLKAAWDFMHEVELIRMMARGGH